MSDSDADESAKEKAQGDKRIKTICRINPVCGFTAGCVHIDPAVNEVVVSRLPGAVGQHKGKASSKSFIVDAPLDIIPLAAVSEKKHKHDYASQQRVWDVVREMLESKIQDETSDILVLANGSSGSGKSYTLFGESNYEDRGIIPRFADYIYDHQQKNVYRDPAQGPSVLHAQQVFLSMSLVWAEELVDLLHLNNPLRRWNQHDHLSYTDSMGPINSAAQFVMATNAEELLEFVGLGLKAAAACSNMLAELYASSSIVITMLIVHGPPKTKAKDAPSKLFGVKSNVSEEENQRFQNYKVTKFTFMEMPSADNPPLCPVEVDRLVGMSPQFRASRSIQLPPGVGNSGGISGVENPYAPSLFNVQHRRSVVNYLLQDCLYKYPNAIVITCLRGAAHTFDEDAAAMDAMMELSDNFNQDATSRRSLSLRDFISMLESDARLAERGAINDDFQDFLDSKGGRGGGGGGVTADSSSAGKKSGVPTAPKASLKQSRRTREIKPPYEYSQINRDDGIALRKKCNFLKHLAEYLSFTVKKDKESKEILQRLCNYGLPFVPAFHKSMSTPTCGIVINYDYLEDPRNKVPFSDVLRSFLTERGIFVKPPKIKVSAGMYDAIDFGDDDDDDASNEARLKAAKIAKPPSSTGVAHGDPWSYEIESMDPYAVLLSPNSCIAEFYGKIPLPKGTTVVRSKSGNASMPEALSLSIYSTTPSEKDTEKDVHIYRQTLKDLCGENLIPREALDLLEAEIRAETEDSSIVKVDEASEAVDHLYGSPDADRKKKEAATENARVLVNFIYIHGPGILPLHCIFRTEGLHSVFVRPNPMLNINGKPAKCEVFVNGLPLEDEIPLQDNDIVRLGASRFLLIRVPVKPMKMNEINSLAREERFAQLTVWERSMVRSYSLQLKEAIGVSETNRRHVSHIDINRELAAVMKTADRTPLHQMEAYTAPDDLIQFVYSAISPWDKAYLCTVIATTYLVNFWASGMRRYLKTTFQLMTTSKQDHDSRGRIIVVDASEVAASAAAQATAHQSKLAKADAELNDAALRDEWDEDPVTEAADPSGRRKGMMQVGNNAAEAATGGGRVFSASIMCENIGDRPGKFSWNSPIATERLYLMKLMSEYYNSAWCSRDTAWLDTLYEPDQDPFNDTQEDELIGVGYLYLDSLQYLVDMNDIVPIVNLQGHKCGAIKIKGRVWIDKIETAPPYLTIDKETNLKEFENRNCVLRLYFESLMDLPPTQCASTFVRFNFFYHNKPYSTIRHGGSSIHPFLHNAIRIDQRITGDFLEYIARGSLELEVYGKRKVKETRKPSVSALIKNNFLTGEAIPEFAVATHAAAEETDPATAGANAAEKAETDAARSNEEALEEKIRELTMSLQKSQNTLNANKKAIENLTTEKTKLEEKVKRQETKFAEFEETLPPVYRSSKNSAGSKKNQDTVDGSAACTVC